MNGVVCSLLAGVSVLAAVGIRYPLQMLPVPLFELVSEEHLADDSRATALVCECDRRPRNGDGERLCACGGLIPLIPWRCVQLANYIRKPGDRGVAWTATKRFRTW